MGIPHWRDPRGSPFQVPTRLADGLGHGSDLGQPETGRPFAPASILIEAFGSPALTSRKGSQLRLHYCCRTHPTKARNVKIPAMVRRPPPTQRLETAWAVACPA